MSALFKPLQLGSLTLPNRIGMSALTRSRAPDAIPSNVVAEYYAQRAAGGASLIITEGILISRQGTVWPRAPGIWNNEQVAQWKKVTAAVHAAGSRIYAQLWHVGRLAHPDTAQHKLSGTPVYGPSAIAAKGGEFRELPGNPAYVAPTAVPDPWTIIAEYKQAAINAKEAGFDGVELQGASGYLPVQFLDSGSNLRTDQWGGSIEDRARFGLEALKVMKEVFGPNVSLKINPADGYNDIGMPLQETLDTFNYFLREVDKLKLSCVVLVRYNGPTGEGTRATVHDILESYRPVIKNAKLFLNGGVTPTEGAELVESGKVDGVFFGFLWITHPDLVKRIQHGKALDNAPDFTRLQTGKDDSDFSVGYTDYPTAVY